MKKLNILHALIILQALLAVLGSLYYQYFGDPGKNLCISDFLGQSTPANCVVNLFPVGQGKDPCVLCWFARILMYPILVLSIVGLVTKDKKFTNYILPFAVATIPLEIYQTLLLRSIFSSSGICTLGTTTPCTNNQGVNYYGFVTIPFLCLVASIVITVLAIAYAREAKKLNNSHNSL